MLPQELSNVRKYLGEAQYNAGKYEAAATLFERITSSDEFAELLTLPA